MFNIPKWKYNEIQEINKLAQKAEKIEKEAITYKDSRNYDLCIRRAQEAFELYMKTIFKLLKESYPTYGKKGHELCKEIVKVYPKLKYILEKSYFSKEEFVQILRGSFILSEWRERALYGEEKLQPISIHESFIQKEVDLALKYIETVSSLHFRVLSYFYQTAEI